jgi:hypothetical protein
LPFGAGCSGFRARRRRGAAASIVRALAEVLASAALFG